MGRVRVSSTQTPPSRAGQKGSMAPRRSGLGRRGEPGGKSHPGMAQTHGDPHSSDSILAKTKEKSCIDVKLDTSLC